MSRLASPEFILLAVGGLCVVCWTLVVTLRLSAAGARRLNLVPTALLTVAFFLPSAATILVYGRQGIGVDDTELIRLGIYLYLLGVVTTLLCARRVNRGGGDKR